MLVVAALTAFMKAEAVNVAPPPTEGTVIFCALPALTSKATSLKYSVPSIMTLTVIFVLVFVVSTPKVFRTARRPVLSGVRVANLY